MDVPFGYLSVTASGPNTAEAPSLHVMPNPFSFYVTVITVRRDRKHLTIYL